MNEIETAFVKFKQKCDEGYELKETVIDPPESLYQTLILPYLYHQYYLVPRKYFEFRVT